MLAPKTDFIGIEGVAHLAAGGETPMLRRHLDAAARFAEHKAGGMAGRDHFFAARERACTHLAAMLGLDAADFALLGSSSQGITQVVSSFDWQPGDSVVVGDIEFPSGLFGLARLRDLGVDVRVVAARDWYLDVEDLIAACDTSTRLVYASHVSYLTGQRLDLARLSAGVHAVGAALLVDATHGLGVVQVPGQYADFVVSSCYKWLLASHMGILAWNRRVRPAFTPLGVGWRSASAGPTPGSYHLHPDAIRAEAGNPNHLDVYMLDGALDYLAALGIDRIEAYILEQGRILRDGLLRHGLAVITPATAHERAGNICIAHPDGESVARRAAAQGLLIWGGDGRIRLSVHCYVTPEDIALALDLLPGMV